MVRKRVQDRVTARDCCCWARRPGASAPREARPSRRQPRRPRASKPAKSATDKIGDLSYGITPRSGEDTPTRGCTKSREASLPPASPQDSLPGKDAPAGFSESWGGFRVIALLFFLHYRVVPSFLFPCDFYRSDRFNFEPAKSAPTFDALRDLFESFGCFVLQ